MFRKILGAPAVQVSVHLAVLVFAVVWIASGNVAGYIFALLALLALAVDAYEWQRGSTSRKPKSRAGHEDE
jgi:hypothetical protein